MTLPWQTKLRLVLKYGGFIAFASALVVAGLALLVSGKWKAFEGIIHNLRAKRGDLDLEALDAFHKANQEALDKDEAALKELEAKRKRIEKERESAVLMAQGMTHDEVVDALRARGF